MTIMKEKSWQADAMIGQKRGSEVVKEIPLL